MISAILIGSAPCLAESVLKEMLIASTKSDYDYTITLEDQDGTASTQAYLVTATPNQSADTWSLQLNHLGRKFKKNEDDNDYSSGWPK